MQMYNLNCISMFMHYIFSERSVSFLCDGQGQRHATSQQHRARHHHSDQQNEQGSHLGGPKLRQEDVHSGRNGTVEARHNNVFSNLQRQQPRSHVPPHRRQRQPKGGGVPIPGTNEREHGFVASQRGHGLQRTGEVSDSITSNSKLDLENVFHFYLKYSGVRSKQTRLKKNTI